MKLLLLPLSLLFLNVACNKTPEDISQQRAEDRRDYREEKNEAREDFKEDLNDTREEMQEAQKEQAEEYLEDSEEAIADPTKRKIDVVE